MIMDDLFFHRDLQAFLEEMDFSFYDIITTSNGVYLEDEGDRKTAGVIQKMRQHVVHVCESIRNLFQKKSVEKKMEETEEKLREDPEFRKKKCQIPDYNKLEKNADETIQELTQHPENADMIMKKYRRKRAKLIAKSAFIIVGISTAFFLILKKKDQKINELMAREKKCEHHIVKLQNICRGRGKKIREQDEAIKGLKQKLHVATQQTAPKRAVAATQVAISNAQDKVSTVATNASAAISGVKEVVTTTASDLGKAFGQITGAIGSDASVIQKGRQVKEGVENITQTSKSLINGDTMRSAKKKINNEIRAEKRERFDELSGKRRNAEAALRSSRADAETKERAKKFLSKTKKEWDNLSSVFG